MDRVTIHSGKKRRRQFKDLPLAGMSVPPLESGDRLTRDEFIQRYEATPQSLKAEWIKGVVYVASPVYVPHGEPHAWIVGWLVNYTAQTPGVRLADNTTTDVDPDAVVQPDASLWIDEKFGGRVKIIGKEPLNGASEFVVEISASSASYDLHDKLEIYQRAGVPEYLVLQIYERKTTWFSLASGKYTEIAPDENGLIKSRVFPGLYFHPEKFWAGDLAGLLAVLQEGLASVEHAEFVKQLTQHPTSNPE
jgi:Uma2 family endonuclease